MLKKIKLAISMIIILLLASVVMQNQNFLFNQSSSLHIDLVIAEYTISDQPMYVYFVGCFICGFLLASYFALGKYIRMRRIIKERDTQIETLRESIESDRKEPKIDVAEESQPNAVEESQPMVT